MPEAATRSFHCLLHDMNGDACFLNASFMIFSHCAIKAAAFFVTLGLFGAAREIGASASMRLIL